jgi:hypothetical protein
LRVVRRFFMTDTLPNWRQGCIPRLDIHEARVSEALFAVSLSRVISREGGERG